MSLPLLNTFAGNPLDRAGDLRNDASWLAEQAVSADALAMILWEGRPLLEDHPDGPRLAWVDMVHARKLVPDRELFLGLWKAAPVFAVEFEGSIDPANGPVRGLGHFSEMREAAAVLAVAFSSSEARPSSPVVSSTMYVSSGAMVAAMFVLFAPEAL